MSTDPARIVPLAQATDFRVGSDDPDVRGWEVVAADRRRIGEVDELLVDPAAMKVRYLDVEVEPDLVDADRDRHVLVPIGYARLDRDARRVVVDELRSDQVATLPGRGAGPLTREREHSVRRSFDRGDAGGGRAALDLYDDPLFDDRRFYGAGPGNPLA